jgi:23S rRNA (cytidine1920-2'-O)/16S rRNA (cytidine1409-2'-O)-methyltransferase
VNHMCVDKPGTEFDPQVEIQIKPRSRYVSRGGEKLAKALETFAIQVSGRICLDGGISTGGFTDCLFQAGASRVYGIDVGYGQVDWGLRNDPRLMLRERTNFRHLTPDRLYQPDDPVPDLGVMDVSFISLTKVLPALWSLLIPPHEVILLVKPQFEVGREQIGKKGVVRDSKAQAGAIAQVMSAATELGWHHWGLTWSPLQGPAGNIEYLLWMGDMARASVPCDLDLLQLTDAAQRDFRSG